MYYIDMGSRSDIELWLILTDPIEARNYISSFDWSLPPDMRPDKVVLDSGRVIYFKHMSDQDAVTAAMELLRSVEIPMIMREKAYEQWEH